MAKAKKHFGELPENVVVLSEVVAFDSEGHAEVSDEVAAILVQIPGYSIFPKDSDANGEDVSAEDSDANGEDVSAEDSDANGEDVSDVPSEDSGETEAEAQITPTEAKVLRRNKPAPNKR